MPQDTIFNYVLLAGAALIAYNAYKGISNYINPQVNTAGARSILTSYGAQTGQTTFTGSSLPGGALSQGATGIVEKGLFTNTTYFLTSDDYNRMSPWQKLELSLGAPLSQVVG